MLKVKEWKVGEVFYFVETGKNADFMLLPHYGIEVKGHTVSKVLKEPYGKVITIFDENETVYDLEAWKEQLFTTSAEAERYAETKEQEMDAKYASAPALKGDLVEWLPKYWQSKKGRGQQYIYLSCKSQDKEALVKDLQELGCRWKSGKTVECADELPDEIRIFLDYYIEPVFSSWCSGYKRHVEKENGVLFLEYWKLGLHEDANGQELY